jgi:hypothetical protein
VTSRPPHQCMTCQHWRSPLDTDLERQTCTAYPDGIPADVWAGRSDHRQPQPGDGGIRWTPARPGVTYPEAPKGG